MRQEKARRKQGRKKSRKDEETSGERRGSTRRESLGWVAQFVEKGVGAGLEWAQTL
jgi:hypothetical protein